MEIKKSNENSKTIFYIEGRIDTKTSLEFQETIETALNNKEINIELNLKKVDYLSSAGLRAILYLQKKINNISSATLEITHVNDVVMEIFEMTGFTEFLNIVSEKI